MPDPTTDEIALEEFHERCDRIDAQFNRTRELCEEALRRVGGDAAS